MGKYATIDEYIEALPKSASSTSSSERSFACADWLKQARALELEAA
jgi:hypothetical protein